MIRLQKILKNNLLLSCFITALFSLLCFLLTGFHIIYYKTLTWILIKEKHGRTGSQHGIFYQAEKI